MPRSRADENRRIRQEALREQLSKQGHVQHVVEIANKMESAELSDADVRRLKTKADIHLALIRKYIPDLKAVEMQLEGEVRDVSDEPQELTPDEWSEKHCLASAEGAAARTD